MSNLIQRAKDLLIAIDSNMESVSGIDGAVIREQYISEELEDFRKALTIAEAMECDKYQERSCPECGNTDVKEITKPQWKCNNCGAVDHESLF